MFLRKKNKFKLLRISIGIIYVWFGILKFFDHLSPAQELATNTMSRLCFGLIPETICYLLLASVETVLGLMLVLNIFISRTIKLALLHLVGTFTPMFIQPEIFFREFPFAITLVGQYILKNMVIFCALLVIYPYPDKRKEI